MLNQNIINIKGNNPIFPGKNYPAVELEAAKNIFTGLLLACQNFSLYPQGHTICMNSLNLLHHQLESFLDSYGTLRLEIEAEGIVSKGELISEGLPVEGTLHFTLFQVGIRWMELLKGIELEELRDILVIVVKFSKLSAEPEGDIVTAFWEAQFPHMQYEVAEFSWGDNPQEMTEEISDLNERKTDGTPQWEFDWEELDTQKYPPIDKANLTLSPQETAMLNEMIQQEEEADQTAYLEALMDSLLQHREKENFKLILDVLLEEFSRSLSRKDFIVALRILQGLRYVLDISKPDSPGAGLLIEEFFNNASGLESLSPLIEVWSDLDSENSVIFEQIVILLKPQAIHSLVTLLPQDQPAPLLKLLLDSILFLASQERHPLEIILNNSDENLLEKLLPVIVNLPGRQSLKYLKRLTRHPSSHVRHEAVKGIFMRDPAFAKNIFNLIEDKDDLIRQLVLEQLGRSRDETSEDLLLSYLSKITTHTNEEEHLLRCFRTLGKCGSTRSIFFLRETLFKRVWIPGFWKSTLRKGAAIALAALNLPEAESVLREASRSPFLGLRAMVKNIMQEFSHKEAVNVVG